jgi:hypothetical protein
MGKGKKRSNWHIIRYPSGHRFLLDGELIVGMLTPELFGPAIDQPGAEIVILDPRGIVTDRAGKVLYSPRLVPLDLHSNWVIEWLAENPEWDRDTLAQP